jgi:hypothetical protein
MPSYVTIANVQGLIVDHLRVLIKPDVFERFPRSALDLHQINGAALTDVVRQPNLREGDGPSAVHAANCSEILLDGAEFNADESKSQRVNLQTNVTGTGMHRIAK